MEHNKTRLMLEHLEADVLTLIGEMMYSVLDNGDRPDRRIDAIIGLNNAKRSILDKLDKVSESIS